ncbi:MAG: GTPase ObgE [Planctomycetota bacterium]|jgi:GTP-binding protein
MFIDETEIVVSSGKGGDGVVSFRHEKYQPRGGPDGGDGGRGGDVVLRAVSRLNTLAGLQHRRRYKAGVGRQGEGGNRSGRAGESLVIELPVGTLVRDAERGHVLRDLDAPDVECVIVAGGAGGRGNRHFASATNQTPRRATPGRPGLTRSLRLELRLVADVGLAGLPNAGKSTFLRRVSAARPKVADYPFTTLAPALGIAVVDESDLVIADIPGLIEGAHRGAGLGDRFLRHVARTRVLMHLVDALGGPEQALADWRTIRDELARADLGLEHKPSLIVVSRADLSPDPAAVQAALAEASGAEVQVMAAISGRGVPEVLRRLRALVETAPSGKSGGPDPSKD